MIKKLFRHLMISVFVCLFGVQGYAFYEPDYCRWVSPDPAGEAADPNLYRFCKNDPINHYDPDGREANDISGYNSDFNTDVSGRNDSNFGEYYQIYPITPKDYLKGGAVSVGAAVVSVVGVYGGQFVIQTSPAWGPVALNNAVRITASQYGQAALAGGAFTFLAVLDNDGTPLQALGYGMGGAAAGVGFQYAANGAPGLAQWVRNLPRVNLTPSINQAIRAWQMSRPMGSTAGGVINPFAQEEAALKPYGGPGGGHHVPAQSAFPGAKGYDVNRALAIPNAELARLGVRHGIVTGAQQTLYRLFARNGTVLTWDVMERIEAEALIRGGMNPEMARATVQKAIKALQSAGVTGPIRIPWGN